MSWGLACSVGCQSRTKTKQQKYIPKTRFVAWILNFQSIRKNNWEFNIYKSMYKEKWKFARFKQRIKLHFLVFTRTFFLLNFFFFFFNVTFLIIVKSLSVYFYLFYSIWRWSCVYSEAKLYNYTFKWYTSVLLFLKC